MSGPTAVYPPPATDNILKPQSNGDNIITAKPAPRRPIKQKISSIENEKAIQKAMADIDEMELSDIEIPEFNARKRRFMSLKSERDDAANLAESERRKVSSSHSKSSLILLTYAAPKRRRPHIVNKFAEQLSRHVAVAQARFRLEYEDEATREVHNKEIQDEKERKKDMQRKRRREKTVQTETIKRNATLQRVKEASDAASRAKLLKEAQKAEIKIRTTKRILEGGDDPKELREVTPMAPNLEGGIMDSFQTNTDPSASEIPKKKGRGGARPRKSKEQKQAEKDLAEAAHAEQERNELVMIAPKEEAKEPAKLLKRESKASKDTPPVYVPFVSKGYNQIYDQIMSHIWKSIPKVHRIKNESYSNKHSNLRKTSQLASKEARRWQLKTNKSTKDAQARAKRCMREMMGFWKRNEREERDLRRVAEKQELENAKRAEQERENNRQKRKLNFLISQTELYSHFVGRKIKTDEVERSTDDPDVAVSGQKADSKIGTEITTLAASKSAGKVANFEDLDFDDENALRQAAVANAQSAIQEAQDKARAFNKGGQQPKAVQEDFDEGEMNFQNPTSLGDVNIEQPKMLNAQLKEYQLKGLNWLANLYEQGINGILADEMGLGKTIQSISVMAYLAEHHKIWGPFLVIAPSSTLHNWQQEITKFVPELKVLPYWGSAKDRKVLRKFWDRKHITYTRESSFHVLITSYQLVVQDTQYFQKIRWQYMILDEAQAIKSSTSSRWKSLLGFHCRNRLLLTGTPIQNNMQELWALLHFIMPSLFDNHEEFSDWFSKDIESHAQSNTKLNEDQLKRLHMILKPFMLRRIKKHVQKELGDKIEVDLFCDLAYRQRAYYTNLRDRINFEDLVDKVTVGSDQDAASLMNLVMQFRKVCNHPDLFERAETTSPFSFAYFAETASFMREGPKVNVGYSTRNLIEYVVPRLLNREGGRLDLAGRDNLQAGFRGKWLNHKFNIWTPENIKQSVEADGAFSWLRFADTSVGEASNAFYKTPFDRAVAMKEKPRHLARLPIIYDEEDGHAFTPAHAMFNIVDRNERTPLAEVCDGGHMSHLLNVATNAWAECGLTRVEPCARPSASAPPIELVCSSRGTEIEKTRLFFNVPVRRALYGPSEWEERQLIKENIEPTFYPVSAMLPAPLSEKARFTNIQNPSMRRFVTDSGKLAKLDQLLGELKAGGHRVLLYFQMTKMMDLMEEYLTYRNYKYLRLDGSTKLEDRRDTVHDFQTRPEIFIFVLSTRAGGLGINLTSADTVIFYDSDWNPTIDSQAMDRAHRLGQTKQVTVYRMITRGTIEERIRKRALQKEEVQRVVISGGSGGGVDFNTRSRDSRTKDIALWLADDEQAEMIELKEKEAREKEAKEEALGVGGKIIKKRKRAKDISLDDMYHEGMRPPERVLAKCIELTHSL